MKNLDRKKVNHLLGVITHYFGLAFKKATGENLGVDCKNEIYDALESVLLDIDEKISNK